MILVCVTDQHSCIRLIEAGHQLALRSRERLQVISVRPRRAGHWLASDEMEFLFERATQLDAEMVVLFHDFAAEAVVDYMRGRKTRAVIVGTPPERDQSVFIAHLLESCPDIPVICVDEEANVRVATLASENRLDSIA